MSSIKVDSHLDTNMMDRWQQARFLVYHCFWGLFPSHFRNLGFLQAFLFFWRLFVLHYCVSLGKFHVKCRFEVSWVCCFLVEFREILVLKCLVCTDPINWIVLKQSIQQIYDILRSIHDEWFEPRSFPFRKIKCHMGGLIFEFAQN